MDWNRPELEKCGANYAPLSPVSFLARAARFFGNRVAVIDRERQFTYREFDARCRRLASALSKVGVGPGDTVSVVAANVLALLEVHYAVPMLGAVLNPINIRLDAPTIAFTLEHGEAKVILVDSEFHGAVGPALEQVEQQLLVIDISDEETAGMPRLGEIEYEDFLLTGDADFTGPGPGDEWDPICLLYTSGTTGNPKGAVNTHRGAYLNALSNAVTFGLDHESRYLWTLPMVHCSGWTYTWAVTAAAGTHICLRRVEPERIFNLISRHHVTHMCGAPIVLNLMANAAKALKQGIEHQVNVMTAASAPPPTVLEAMARLDFNVTHTYGLTEVYGPAVVCSWHEEWDELPMREQAERKARQGVRYPMLEELIVADPDTLEPVPRDGKSIGEVMFRGNVVMKGYLKNPEATKQAFAGGYFHSGDLAVCHPDGYIEIKDRSKDVIISGGENISSIEIEATLYRHAAVLEAAVTAMPDKKWGETPCAFVDLRPDADGVTEDEIIGFCRDNMAHFKAPRKVVFGPLPKTSTGKIRKFELREKARKL